jgi:hypothetical protein
MVPAEKRAETLPRRWHDDPILELTALHEGR